MRYLSLIEEVLSLQSFEVIDSNLDVKNSTISWLGCGEYSTTSVLTF